MDVVEIGSTFNYTPNQNGMEHTTVHANGYDSLHIVSASHNALTDPSGYHVYGLFWDSTSVSVYVDGYMTYRETNPNLVSKVKQLAILSNEIGVTGSTDLGEGRAFWGLPPTTNGGYGDVNTSQAKMTVDYVRVWAAAGTSSSSTVIPTPPVASLPVPTIPTRNPLLSNGPRSLATTSVRDGHSPIADP